MCGLPEGIVFYNTDIKITWAMKDNVFNNIFNTQNWFCSVFNVVVS